MHLNESLYSNNCLGSSNSQAGNGLVVPLLDLG
jgi:hypothetical protein